MRRLILLIPAVLLAAGCAVSQTRIESSWLDPTLEDPGFERIAVLALFDTESESRNFETEAVSQLLDRDVYAIAGHTLLDPNVRYTQEEMERELLNADVDGLLIYRLIAVDERQVYRRPDPYLPRMPPGIVWSDPFYWYYYPHWNYYWHWRSSWAVTRSRGYWQEYTYVIVESSLYDTDSDRLIWTAKSETMDGAHFDRLAASVADEITDNLVRLDLLEPSRQALALGEDID